MQIPFDHLSVDEHKVMKDVFKRSKLLKALPNRSTDGLPYTLSPLDHKQKRPTLAGRPLSNIHLTFTCSSLPVELY